MGAGEAQLRTPCLTWVAWGWIAAMTPADVTAAYLKDLKRCLDALMEQYVGIDRGGWYLPAR